ncbi:transposase IS4 family protein [Clostridium tetanomorphum DSM 665]|nr:transposase [Clostridium tetanomorphum]KAJ52562.1 transposase IS4 family protein [Clostridium tetanomorphum DSM 665]SQC01958.1 Transposase DDE domain [Clostridium tetanomorphum]
MYFSQRTNVSSYWMLFQYKDDSFKYSKCFTVIDENEEEFRVLTNIFDMTPEDIFLLYRVRWKIETFFKWIRQNLRIKQCIDYNKNSIKIQIYTALIIYMLIYILKEVLKVKTSMLKITKIIKSNILENTDDVFLGYQK